MQTAIIGTGYVGLPTGAGLAELGHKVICVDSNEEKIRALNAGKVTLFEEGLEELLHKHRLSGNLAFTTDLPAAVSQADIVIIAVGTPPHPVTHEADLQYLKAAAAETALHLSGYTVVAVKSTVPVGTCAATEKMMHELNPQAEFDVVSLPEFLREGFAVHDFFHPDRIVAGTSSERAQAVISELYKPLLAGSPDTKILFVNRQSGETIKYASNSFLALKIHFINEIADLCEKTGADVRDVALGMGLDHRIGNFFLTPGPGFGGSCFPKDTMALAYTARKNGIDLSLVEATMNGNRRRMERMAGKILSLIEDDAEKPVIAVLGTAFKNGTDDCRFSPAMTIIENILQSRKSLRLRIFDPKAADNASALLRPYADRITFCKDPYDACTSADILAVLTEWKEFSALDLEAAAGLMRRKYIADLRNMLDRKKAEQSGFTYICIGDTSGNRD